MESSQIFPEGLFDNIFPSLKNEGDCVDDPEFRQGQESGLNSIRPASVSVRRMKAIDMEDYYRKNPNALKQYLKDLGYIEDPAKIEEDADDPFKEIVFDKDNLPELNNIP